MHNTKAVIEYWQQGARQQALMDLHPATVASSWEIIDRRSCLQGKIDDLSIIQKLLAHGSEMVVVPYFAKKHDQYFFPLMLLVDLEDNGAFKPRSHTAFPIVPNFALETAVMQPISIANMDCVSDYLVLTPPDWIDQVDLLDWAAQIKYADQMLLHINNNSWLTHLESLQFYVQAEALIFPLAAVTTMHHMDHELLKNINKIEIIAADRRAAKSTYIKRLIVDGWTEAAVKQAQPPEYVWLRYKEQITYTTIFEAVVQAPLPLPDQELPVLQSVAHKELAILFNIYIKGKQVARNWQELAAKIIAKYAEQGGIDARIKHIQMHLKDAHARARHMQVLQSIWLRQVELVPVWSKIFDLVPGWQKRRLYRLFMFFKQNFPSEVVQGFNFAQLDHLFNEKIQRAKNSERFVADALYQTESDIRQLDLVKDKLIQWAAHIDPSIIDVHGANIFIESDLRDKLEAASVQYWQIYFALHSDSLRTVTRAPDKIGTLIVEHAEYVSPMLAAQLLAMSSKAVIMGSYAAIISPRFPVAIDYELAKYNGLVNCDADYEDLQFDGVSAALGNLWGLATTGREADKILAAENTQQIIYTFMHVESVSEQYYGSKVNMAEVAAIIDWLKLHYRADQSLVIFTTFSGQAQYLSNQLLVNKFESIPVRLAQVPSFACANICLFSPVYTQNDPGPYSFDRGVEIFDNLLANVSEQLIVFGDRFIFKPELHSASGMFAKNFVANSVVNSELIPEEL